MKTVLAALFMLFVATPCFAEPAPPRAGHGVAEITRDWWYAASPDQRETFVRASIFGYAAGRSDAVNPGDATVFSKPAHYYVMQITRFYALAPSVLQSSSPGTVLFCLADTPAPRRVLTCGPIRSALGLF
jgi:hypothetical protein